MTLRWIPVPTVTRMRRMLLPILLAASLGVAACGSDSAPADESGEPTTSAVESASSAPTDAAAGTDPAVTAAPTTDPAESDAPATSDAPVETDGPTSTVAPEPAVTPTALAGPGPYAVGVTTRELPAGNPVEVWYPADESARGQTVSYAVREFLPPAVGDLVPDTIDDTRSIDAARDAQAADGGPFPVVLFSHGSTAFRLQSSVLAQHLASWGIVTASTDHPSRDLRNVIGGTAEGQRPAVDDVRAMRDELTKLADDPILGGALDNGRVALGGHSAGGGTIVEMAGDDGILGYVSYASGLGDAAPDVPSLFMAGELDMIVDPVERTQAAFERAPAPSWLWSFADAGHLAFSDLCAIGTDGATLIDLAEAAGLGELVDDRLRTLATDGCEEPNRPVEEVWPGVHQAATAFYRWVFGDDSEPVGLDESAVTEGVTVTSK